MKIVAISDLHGILPQQMPEGDLLLIAGDICIDGEAYQQHAWLSTKFRWWLESLPYKHVVCCWGNHDWIGLPEYAEAVASSQLPCKFLTDEETTIDGLRIYGTPHQPRFYDWAFNLDEPQLAEKWALIPEGIDVLLSHGPPHGAGDLAPDWNSRTRPRPNIHVGSPSLALRILELRPRLTVFGHIHSGYGRHIVGGLTMANVSYVDEMYRPANEPMVFTFDEAITHG